MRERGTTNVTSDFLSAYYDAINIFVSNEMQYDERRFVHN